MQIQLQFIQCQIKLQFIENRINLYKVNVTFYLKIYIKPNQFKFNFKILQYFVKLQKLEKSTNNIIIGKLEKFTNNIIIVKLEKIYKHYYNCKIRKNRQTIL